MRPIKGPPAKPPVTDAKAQSARHRQTRAQARAFVRHRSQTATASATHRRGSNHLLPLDPDEYGWPPQRFQTQVAKIRLERQNSKIGDHHFTRARLQFELSDPLHTGLARYKLVKPAEDRRQTARRSHVRKIITDRTCNLPKLDRRLRIVRAYGKDDRQGAIVAPPGWLPSAALEYRR